VHILEGGLSSPWRLGVVSTQLPHYPAPPTPKFNPPFMAVPSAWVSCTHLTSPSKAAHTQSAPRAVVQHTHWGAL
jgi:hypothetical protein